MGDDLPYLNKVQGLKGMAQGVFRACPTPVFQQDTTWTQSNVQQGCI